MAAISVKHTKVYKLAFELKETSKTIRNIDSIWVKSMKAHVKDGKIKSYGVVCKVSFRVGKDKEEKKGKDKDEKKE